MPNLQKRLLCGYQVAQSPCARSAPADSRLRAKRALDSRFAREARSVAARSQRTTRSQANGIENPKIFRRVRFARARLSNSG
jgi:hypothetical protein